MSIVPFAVLRIDHIVLRVSDLERSIDFFRDVLGCQLERRRDDLGLIHLRTGKSMIDLISVDGPLGRHGGAAPGAAGRNVDHLCLRVDPFEPSAMLAHLARFGIEPTGPVANNFGAEGDGPSLYIADPDGNTIELKGPSQQGGQR